MGNKLYVGNLPYSVRDSDLEQAFGQFGPSPAPRS
jgi:cold-inducible RNA-binding protein